LRTGGLPSTIGDVIFAALRIELAFMKKAIAAEQSDRDMPVSGLHTKSYRPRAPHATSFLMSRVRATNTRMEIKLRSALHRKGYRYRKNVHTLPGKPDIVFPRERVAIFVDGDYWHARILKDLGIEALRQSLKTNNREFWVTKLQRNYERDIAVTAELEQLGWTVVRMWESDLKMKMDECVRAIVTILEDKGALGAL
jgi:DNA mismatch endonuclease, patch repair protein